MQSMQRFRDAACETARQRKVNIPTRAGVLAGAGGPTCAGAVSVNVQWQRQDGCCLCCYRCPCLAAELRTMNGVPKKTTNTF